MTTELEARLISRIIDQQNVLPAIKIGLKGDHFEDPEFKNIYEYILDFQKNPDHDSRTPSRDLVFRKFPFFKDYYEETNDLIESLSEDILNDYKNRAIPILMNKGMDIAEEDPKRAIELIRDESRRLSHLGRSSKEVELSMAANEIYKMYSNTKENKGMMGLAWPWPSLNEATLGIMKQNFIVMYGRPKSMKTWLALYIGMHLHLRHKCKVQFFSYEMSEVEIQRRALAIAARVSYSDFFHGRLSDEEESRLKKAVRALTKMRANPNERGALSIVNDPMGGISSIRQRVKEFEPDIVIVDSFYKMPDERSKRTEINWKTIGNITSDLKLTAQSADIPILVTSQANRSAEETKGKGTRETAFSDSPLMDCDMLISVLKDEERRDKYSPYVPITLRFPAMREGTMDELELNIHLAKEFKEVRHYEGRNLQQEREIIESNKVQNRKRRNPLGLKQRR